MHITSADDVDSPADFDTGVFSMYANCAGPLPLNLPQRITDQCPRRKEDLAVLRYAWKRCREYGRRMTSYRGECTSDRPDFPAGSGAAVSPDHNTPVSIDTPDIVYTEEDDKAIDDYLKANSEFPGYDEMKHALIFGR